MLYSKKFKMEMLSKMIQRVFHGLRVESQLCEGSLFILHFKDQSDLRMSQLQQAKPTRTVLVFTWSLFLAYETL